MMMGGGIVAALADPSEIFPSEPSLTGYPVYGDPLHPADAISDHILPPCLVSLSPANGAQAHVHPIDGVIFCEN